MTDKFDKNKEALKGLIKEVNQEMPNEKLAALEEKAAIQEETNAKILESNTELKAQLESMQGKLVTLKQNVGSTNTFLFKGFNPDMSKNFRSTLSSEDTEKVAKVMIKSIEGPVFTNDVVDKVFAGANAIPVQYGNAVMGLAELSSVALSYANVIVADAPTIKLPTKGTRDTVDSQASGTANTAGTSTIGQLTWTIDKRVGNYIELYNSQLEDANFDIVNQIIVPMQAEAIGQNADDEMFNGTEFTSSVSDVTASIDSTASVVFTFANLTTMFYALEWERILGDPKWFGSRAALKDIASLADTTGRPIFQQVPINGRPSQMLLGAEYVICPSIANAPADGAIRLAFGDPKHYTIFVRGGEFVSMVNPYIKMKEDITQFICKARMDGNVSDHATASSSGAWTIAQRND
jgi:HK97 family phage major capsid protein